MVFPPVDPTRGVDVTTRRALYAFISRVSAQGAAVVVVTLDLRYGLALFIITAALSPKLPGFYNNLRVEDFVFALVFIGWAGRSHPTLAFATEWSDGRSVKTNLKQPSETAVMELYERHRRDVEARVPDVDIAHLRETGHRFAVLTRSRHHDRAADLRVEAAIHDPIESHGA